MQKKQYLKLKKVVKKLMPPIILDSINSVMSKYGHLRAYAEQQGEKDSHWYDLSFDETNHWRSHYSMSPYYFLWSVIVDRIVRSKIHSSILEIGCGSGQLASFLKDKDIINYHGLDFSKKRIEYARKICPQLSFYIEDAFLTDLIEEIDYEVVICTEFLEHVENDIDIIERLKPGSRLYATVPNFPFISHVRYFKSEEDVKIRYHAYFTELSVDSFLADDKGAIFYLMEGLKS